MEGKKSSLEYSKGAQRLPSNAWRKKSNNSARLFLVATITKEIPEKIIAFYRTSKETLIEEISYILVMNLMNSF